MACEATFGHFRHVPFQGTRWHFVVATFKRKLWVILESTFGLVLKTWLSSCSGMKMSLRFFMLDNFLCFGGWVGAVTPAILAQEWQLQGNLNFWCQVMSYVAPVVRGNHFRVATALWIAGWSLAGVYCDSRGSTGRSKTVGIDPSLDLHGLRDYGSHYIRAAADRDGGQPTGTPIQSRQTVGICSRRWCSTRLGGQQPLGGDCGQRGDEGFNVQREQSREKAKVWPDTGSTRRRRVHLPWRRDESLLVRKVRGEDGWPTCRSGESNTGPNVSVDEEGEDAVVAPLHRLLGMDPVFEEGSQDGEVPDIRSSRRWVIRGEDGGRTCQLSAMADFFQGDEDGIHHARPPSIELVASVGKSHGEVGEQVWQLLALAGGSGEQGEGRAFGQDACDGEVIHRSGRKTTIWMERKRTMAGGVEESFGRCGVLAGTSPRPGTCLVGSWRQRSTTYTSGRSCESWSAWWIASSSRRSFPTRGGRECGGEGFSSQSEKRSKEKEVESREGRAGSLEDSERIKRWRCWKRREERVRFSRRRVLCLEQWKWRLRKPGTRRRMPGKEEEATSVHPLQVTRSSIERLSFEEVKAFLLTFGMKKKGEGHGASSSRAGGDKSQAEKKKEKSTRMGARSHEEDERVEGDRIEIDGEMLSEAEYISSRTFKFLHHFCGGVDHLGLAIEEEAKKRGMSVVTIGVDKELGGDLSSTFPYTNHLESIAKRDVDGYHSGFPCGSYSRLRWRPAPGLPGPVRRRSHPYGLPDNNKVQQAEADLGTVLMCRSIEACRTMHKAELNMRVPAFFTMENPPPSNRGEGEHISAWEMPEMLKFIKEVPNFKEAFFHTCRFQQKVPKGLRIKKPQTFGGTLNGLVSLARLCNCGDAKHLEVVGKERSKQPGQYPLDLCDEYARLALDHFEKMGRAEYLDAKQVLLAKKISKMKEQAETYETEGKEAVDRLRKQQDREIKTPEARKRPTSPMGAPRKKAKVAEEEKEMPSEAKAPSFNWAAGQGKHGSARASTSKASHPKHIAYYGGMRHPAKAVEQLPTVQALGVRMGAAWDKFVKQHKDVLETAETYGTKEVVVHEGLVEKWRVELKKLWGTKPPPSLRLKEKDAYESPVDWRMLRSWAERSGDPETEVPSWLEEGCPLGIELPIKCCGIFPPMDEEENKMVSEVDMNAELERKGFRNYASMEENQEDAMLEIQRYEKEGYVQRLPKSEGLSRYANGTISRLGLVLKVKENGEKKRRVVIDLRRSGGNNKSKLPEKLVLPRPCDIIRMLKEMNEKRPHKSAAENFEFAVVDIADAFTTLPLHPLEHKHAVAPSPVAEELLVFKALLFGYRTAPLLYSRFGAMLARLLQSAVNAGEAAHQVYLDDSLWAFVGELKQRSSNLALVLYTLLALKVKVAMHKGERAAHITWVGVRFSMPDNETLVVGLPVKYLEETKEALSKWEGRGMAPLKELRSMAGRTAWLANVLPRAKWVTAVFYAVMKSAEAEEFNVKADGRSKPGLFSVKRLESARKWMLAFLEAAMARPMRKIHVGVKTQMEVKLCCDASPEGLGAVLVINNAPVAAVASPVDDFDVDLLKIEKGSSSSQGILEALCILVAFRHWKKRFLGHVVTLEVQSDSMVALALSQRLGASTATLNWIAAELSLSLEEVGVEALVTKHIVGKANVEADYLSRPSTWPVVKLPPPLEPLAAHIETPSVRTAEYYVLPGPSMDPSLWGSGETPSGSVSTWDSVMWRSGRKSHAEEG